MSIYLSLDAGEPEMLASNKGWSDVIDWAEDLDHDDEEELIHLCDHGWSQRLDALLKCTDSALAAAPPSDANVLSTVHVLRNLIANRGPAEVCTVNSGISADEGPSEETQEGHAQFSLTELFLDIGEVVFDAQWDESKHPRDKGKFATGSHGSTGQTESPGESQDRKAAHAYQKLTALGSKVLSVAGKLEHVIGAAAMYHFSRLPKVMQAPVAGLLYLSFSSYIAGLHAATAIAKERGGEEHAKRVAKVCVAFDIAGAKIGPAAAGVLGAGTLGAIGTSFLPIGSLTYIAYSSVRDPAAVARAASGALTAVKSKLSARFDAEPDREALAAIFDALQASKNPAWLEALLCVAVDETKDVRQAIECAQLAEQESQAPMEDMQEQNSLDTHG